MRLTPVLGALGLAAAVMAPLSSASAHGYWYHGYWHGGPAVGVFDLPGAVVAGAASIIAAPVVLAASVLSPGPYYDPVVVHAHDAGYYGPWYGYGYGYGYYGGPGYYGPPEQRCWDDCGYDDDDDY